MQIFLFCITLSILFGCATNYETRQSMRLIRSEEKKEEELKDKVIIQNQKPKDNRDY